MHKMKAGKGERKHSLANGYWERLQIMPFEKKEGDTSAPRGV